MIINLKLLKMHPHTSQTFQWQGNGNPELLAGTGGSFHDLIRVNVTIENTGQVFVGNGTVRTAINSVCSRCLKEMVYQLDAPFIAMMTENSNSGYVDVKKHEFLEIDSNGDVDLTPRVEEAILFNLPLIPLCREDCRGICPGCGVDLNTEKCKCEQQEIDPRWEKLRNLK